jgi:EAL domain-containing protein (putative c-di-GMP-specific phosphodiesterase class I)
MIIVQKSAEIKLMELLNIIREPSGWQAVHFHLNDLLEEYKSEYQLKIAINLIYDLLKGHEGGIYQLIDGSLIALCNELDKNLLNKLIFQMRYLYMDDPISYTEDGSENFAFCTAYDLRVQWQEFKDICNRKMALLVRKISAPTRHERGAGQASSPQAKNFDINKLAHFESDLKRIDLHSVLRRQSVCAVQPDMKIRRVFDEVYTNIAHLRQLMHIDVDLLGNRWLFKYMTSLLDVRMLEMISQNLTRYTDSPISLNLNVETLISRSFAEFDAHIKPSSKVGIVIEIPIVDVFSDTPAFHAARREAQKLGYRVCLDGVRTANLMMLDRKKLGVDLVKMQWNADVEADLNSAENKEIVNAVSSFGSNRVILCRCDNKQAVQYGQALGISLFQGRFIDSVQNPNAKVEN